METTETKQQAEAQIKLIHAMLGAAQNQITENGFHFLLWGTLVILASLTQYFLIQTGLGNGSNLVWPAMTVIGVPAGIWYESKRKKDASSVSLHDQHYGFLWLGFGITLGVIIFGSIKNNLSPVPFILGLAGLATFASGGIFKYRPLMAGGIIFWMASLCSLFMAGPEQLLINAAGTFLGYVLPGISLWRNQKKNV